MFEEKFYQLSDKDQKTFQRVANKLLTVTNFVKKEPNFENNNYRFNHDYLFVEEHIELFQEYFHFMGADIKKDDIIDVISFVSEFKDNKVRFNLIETKCLIVLRLLYEELREKISLSLNNLVKIADISERLSQSQDSKKKITATTMEMTLKKMQQYRIIEKGPGPWTDTETQICILPTILTVITNEQYRSLIEETEKRNEEMKESTFD